MAVRVGSARIDEKGGITGGKAGDQNGKEVAIQPWYLHSKKWAVIRAKDPAVREKIAHNMENICNNDNIGYCQGHRTSLTEHAKKYAYDASKVKESCETDCSEGARNCVLYAGITVGTFNTSTEAKVLKATGKFDVIEDEKVCGSSDYLLRGDILVTRTKGHTVVVLDNGSKVSGGTSEKTQDTEAGVKLEAAKSKDSGIAGTYKNLSKHYLKAGAGEKKRSVVSVPSGATVRCYGYYTLFQRERWYYVTVSIRGVLHTGFYNCKYLEKIKK